jgi:hypothetical protein
MKHNGNILARGGAVLLAQEIAIHEFQPSAVTAVAKGLNPFCTTRRSYEAADVSEPVVEQLADEPAPDEPCRPSH